MRGRGEAERPILNRTGRANLPVTRSIILVPGMYDILAGTLGVKPVSKIVAKVLQAIFELKNVTRGPGQSGKL